MYAGIGSVAVRTAAISLIVSVAGTVDAGISRVVFDVNVRAANGGASASFDIAASSFNAQDNEFAWDLSEPVRFVDPQSGNVLGELRSASIVLEGEPNIEMSCEVVAGAQEATFSVSSLKVYFDDGTQAAGGALSARATAAIVLVDVNGNGAQLRGDGPPGTGVIRSSFNGSSVFASLLSSISTSAGGTASGYQNYPAFGFQPVNGDVSEMDSTMTFVLSPNDRATTSSSFELRGSGFQLFEDGDLNCDAEVGVSDIVGFVLALTNDASYSANFPSCASLLADLDADDAVTLADIGAFVTRLSNN